MRVASSPFLKMIIVGMFITPFYSELASVSLARLVEENKGCTVTVRDGVLTLGSESVSEPLVLGDTLNDILIKILDALLTHTHISPAGNTSVPVGAEPVTWNEQKARISAGEDLSNYAYVDKEY